MHTLSTFWRGAVQYGQNLDFTVLHQKAGSWQCLHENAFDVLRSVGVSTETSKQWMSTPPITTIGHAVPMDSEQYPHRLQGHPWAPPVLFVLGDTTGLDKPSFGIVGTRQCTAYGASIAKRLSSGLASIAGSSTSSSNVARLLELLALLIFGDPL